MTMMAVLDPQGYKDPRRCAWFSSMLEIDLISKSSTKPSVVFDSLIPINKGCRVEDVSDNEAEG